MAIGIPMLSGGGSSADSNTLLITLQCYAGSYTGKCTIEIPSNYTKVTPMFADVYSARINNTYLTSGQQISVPASPFTVTFSGANSQDGTLRLTFV